MTEEQKKKLAELKKRNMASFNAYRKKILGVGAGDKEMEFLSKSIPMTASDKDLKFITERTGAAVSEEELLKIKNLIRKRKM